MSNNICHSPGAYMQLLPVLTLLLQLAAPNPSCGSS